MRADVRAWPRLAVNFMQGSVVRADVCAWPRLAVDFVQGSVGRAGVRVRARVGRASC